MTYRIRGKVFHNLIVSGKWVKVLEGLTMEITECEVVNITSSIGIAYSMRC